MTTGQTLLLKWWVHSVGKENMKQINVYQFYQIANAVHPLTEQKAGGPLKSYFYTSLMARVWLHSLASDNLIPVPICRPVAWKVMRALDSLFPQDPEELNKLDMEREVTQADLYSIVQAANEFEMVFSAELQNLATYFVSKKGIYDTNDLISRAEDLFTGTIKEQMSEQARLDIREAGKCLAFDLATASGFHIARAVESVLLDYLKLLCSTIVDKLKDSDRNLGNYIKIAKSNGGEAKVCSSLDQFRELHRNPLIHPDAVLTVEEALTLLGIAQSAIVTMSLEMAKKTNAALGALALLPRN